MLRNGTSFQTIYAKMTDQRGLTGPVLKCSGIAAAILLAWLFWPDSASKARRNNEAYLDHIASVIHRYQQRHGQVPRSIDEALEDANETLPHRGDYYGKSLSYASACASAFLLRASNLELLYANGQRVTRNVFITWVRSHPSRGEDPDDWLVTYGFEKQKDK
jgi:hypothetical protein